MSGFTIDWRALVLAVFGVPAVAAVILLVGRRYLESLVSARFNAELERTRAELQKKLEIHRHELNQDAERLRKVHAEQLQDTAIFSSRRHEVYAKLYGLLVKVHVAMALSRWADVAPEEAAADHQYDIDEVARAAKTSEAAKATLQHRLTLAEHKERIEILAPIVPAIHSARFSSALDRAWRYFTTSAFYLSPRVDAHCNQILRAIPTLTQTPLTPADETFRRMLHDLKRMMREELSAGNYMVEQEGEYQYPEWMSGT